MKNPFMSMWLSGANRAANTVRGKALVEIRRAQASAVKKALGSTKKTRKR